MEIVIGTTNKGKVAEIASILSLLGYELKPMSLDIDENGKDITENAHIKAIEYSKKNPGKFIIAEDSGLVVPYLNGLPGAYSSRFHTIEIDNEYNIINVPKEVYSTDKTGIDKMNNIRLMNLISTVPFDKRAAYFEVCFSVAKDGIILYDSVGHSYGHISSDMKGENGFGYDPIFIGDDTYGKTYAELDSARKNMRSHRKKALKELGLWISKNIEL